MLRREFVTLSIGSSLAWMLPLKGWSNETVDVPWLAQVQRPPETVPLPDRPLAPLLVGPGGTPITNKKEWEVERLRVRQAWMKFLGPMPEQRPPVKLEVLKEDHPDGCTRQLVRYLAESDEPVEGYLLRPAKPLPNRAAVVALHQTSNSSIDEIAGVSGGEPQDLGMQFCRAGYVVFCPRCYLWQTPPGYQIDVKTTVERFRKRHPKTLGMHKMLFDAQRAIDVLETLPDVDKSRIGAVGHSLGAKETLYLAAFDERIKVAVASEGGTTMGSTNWHDPWYLGTGIQSVEFNLNHHQLLALIAPRPFLILGGESGRGAADGNRSWSYIAPVIPVYKLYGNSIRIGLLNHGQGHSMPPDVRKKMIDWVTTYLR